MEEVVVSQKSQEKPEGNTKTSGNQLYRWVFTLPIESQASQLSELLAGFCKEWYFQGEKGEETGYEHWQGCLSLIKKEYFCGVKNLLPGKAHIEPCRDWFAAKNYSNKKETRIEGPYSHKTEFVDTLEYINMYGWQKDLIKELEEKPNDRKIIWFYDKIGMNGKTQLCKWLIVHRDAAYFDGGAKGDISYAYKGQKIVLFNFPRTKEGYVSYDSIESLKDGIFFSKKYESRTKVFNSPHVVVMANFKPELEKLSLDRWDLRKLSMRCARQGDRVPNYL